MNWVGNSEVVAGVAMAVLWWLSLRVARTDKPLSALGFAFWPPSLVWIVAAIILIGHGAGVI